MTTKTMHSKNTSIAASKDKLMDDLRLVVSDAEALLRATANQAGEEAAAARTRIQKSLHVAKERLVDAETVVIERTQQAVKDTDQYVRDNPWQAVGISAIAGVLVGFLVSRR